MDIKILIEKFLEKHSKLRDEMTTLKKSFEDENEFWGLLDKKKDAFFYNDNAFDLLADSLQLVNNKQRLEAYDLKDIEKMSRLLVEYYPDNLQYKIDLINFVYAVLDDESEALNLITEVQQQLQKYNESINVILDELKDGV
jgi:hypothetical protein